MKRLFLVTCLVAFALVAAAGAQDENFRGFYVGANVGGAFGTADARTTTVAGTFFDPTSPAAIAATGRQELKPNGIIGGGQFGYNWHNDDGLMLGFEVDMGAMSLDETRSASAEYPCCAGDVFTVTQGIKTDWLFTVRPRIGYIRHNWLFYATGGLAITNMDYHAEFSDTGDGAAEHARMTDNNMGFTIGGGVEFAIPNSHWSFKGEYLYLRFGDITTNSTNLTCCGGGVFFPTSIFTHTVDLTAHTARFGVNYRF